MTLRLRDLKPTYNVQTAREAMIELNVLTFERSLEDTMAALRHVVTEAVREVRSGQLDLSAWIGTPHQELGVDVDPGSWVLTYPELATRAETSIDDDPIARGPASRAQSPAATAWAGGGHDPSRWVGTGVARLDARAATLERIRALVRRAGITGPAVVLHLLPPYYPRATPGDGALVQAVRTALADERGMAVQPYYPLISDACYLAWRAEPAETIAAHMPALGREYHLPWQDARDLDLDIVNLGPWGRDAHGLTERVHAPFAFERLPGLILKTIQHAFAAMSIAAR